jgi:hypothetical protein
MAELVDDPGPATEALSDALGKADDITEQAIEMSRSLSGRDLTIGLVVGLIAGGVAGYFLARRRLETKYEKIAEQEIDDMREHFRARLVSREEKPDLAGLDTKVSELNYAAEQQPGELNVQVERTPEQQNVFDRIHTEKDADEGWDFAAEMASRTPELPYVIHYNERGERDDLEEISLTYYAVDDVLCDQEDKVVDDQDRVVGLVNLDKFGHGSNDSAIVYVRNEYLHLDIEVVKSPNSYAEEVHGLAHEDPPRRRERPEWQ